MKILFENKDIIIILKERGVPVQRDNSNEKALIEYAEEYIGGDAFVITRLDRPVQGAVLFAKNKISAAKLSRLLQEHKIEKIYYAVVCGELKGKGRLEDYIFHNKRQNMSKIVNKGNVGAKLAILEYEALEYKDNMTFVRINLLTGRHHQIRVQMAHKGYPLYGDTKYNPQFRFKIGAETALFAGGLKFEYDGEIICVKAEPFGGAFEYFC